MDIMVANVWSHRESEGASGCSARSEKRLKVEFAMQRQREWKKRRLVSVGPLGGTSIGLVLKDSMGPGAEWGAMWIVSGFLGPTKTSATGT